MSKDKGNGVIGVIVIIAIVVCVRYFAVIVKQYFSQRHSSYPVNEVMPKDCKALRPENPYNDGGHYAGFEWGASGKSCGGNSSSFIEGCEEYESQEESYLNCLND